MSRSVSPSPLHSGTRGEMPRSSSRPRGEGPREGVPDPASTRAMGSTIPTTSGAGRHGARWLGVLASWAESHLPCYGPTRVGDGEGGSRLRQERAGRTELEGAHPRTGFTSEISLCIERSVGALVGRRDDGPPAPLVDLGACCVAISEDPFYPAVRTGHGCTDGSGV